MLSGGLITAALCSGGGDNAVTTDIIDRITALPIIYGGNIGKSYHYLLHYGDVGNGADSHISHHPENNKSDKPVYYANEYAKPVIFWFVLYKNGGNEVIGAAAVNRDLNSYTYFSEYHSFSTRFKTLPPTDDPQAITEYESYPNKITKRHYAGTEGSVNKYSFNELSLNFIVHYTDETTYYLDYIIEDNKIVAIAPEYTVSSKTTSTGTINLSIYLPFYSTSAAFYSALSAKEMADEMANLTRELNETTN